MTKMAERWQKNADVVESECHTRNNLVGIVVFIVLKCQLSRMLCVENLDVPPALLAPGTSLKRQHLIHISVLSFCFLPGGGSVGLQKYLFNAVL